MSDLILVIDESGAKGYSDQPEKYFGETGVMAGFLFHQEEFDDHKRNLTNLRSKYITTGKLHITDLLVEQQEELREEIVNHLVNNEVVCVFEIIYSEGFYKSAQDNLDMLTTLKTKRKSGVKLSGNDKKELLHAQLFQGVFGKAIAYGLDYIDEDFSILVKTDHVDDGVLNKLVESAEELLNFGTTKITEHTGWDPKTKEVVKGSVSSTVSDPHNVLGDFSNIKYEIQREDSEFTLVADVIANSLYRHLRKRPSEQATCSLNSENSIPEYMKDICFFGATVESGTPYFSDIIFPHPEEKI